MSCGNTHPPRCPPTIKDNKAGFPVDRDNRNTDTGEQRKTATKRQEKSEKTSNNHKEPNNYNVSALTNTKLHVRPAEEVTCDLTTATARSQRAPDVHCRGQNTGPRPAPPTAAHTVNRGRNGDSSDTSRWWEVGELVVRLDAVKVRRSSKKGKL